MAESPERCAEGGGFPSWLFITDIANHRASMRQLLDTMFAEFKEIRDRRVIESLSSWFHKLQNRSLRVEMNYGLQYIFIWIYLSEIFITWVLTSALWNNMRNFCILHECENICFLIFGIEYFWKGLFGGKYSFGAYLPIRIMEIKEPLANRSDSSLKRNITLAFPSRTLPLQSSANQESNSDDCCFS